MIISITSTIKIPVKLVSNVTSSGKLKTEIHTKFIALFNFIILLKH